MDRRQGSNVTSTPAGKSELSLQDRYCALGVQLCRWLACRSVLHIVPGVVLPDNQWGKQTYYRPAKG